MKKQKIFLVTCTGLTEMFFANPTSAANYAFNRAMERGSDDVIRIIYGDRELFKMFCVVCSPNIDELCKKFEDPDGRDREAFIQALKEEKAKNRLVFHMAIRMENHDGEGYIVDCYEECLKKFMEFVERAEMN